MEARAPQATPRSTYGLNCEIQSDFITEITSIAIS